MKVGGHRFDKCGEAKRRQGGLEEDNVREVGSRVEVEQSEGGIGLRGRESENRGESGV